MKLSEIAEQLCEAKQIGFLYHFTHPSHLVKILQDGFLTSKWNQGISLTRNPQLNYSSTSIRMTFDGDKMSQRHKITPFVHAGITLGKTMARKKTGEPFYRAEAEETVKDPFFFKKYLLAIEFNPHMEIKDRSLEIEDANEILEKRYGMSLTVVDNPQFKWPKKR